MLRKNPLNIKCTPHHRSPCMMHFIFLPMEEFVLWHKLKFTNSYLGSISNIHKVETLRKIADLSAKKNRDLPIFCGIERQTETNWYRIVCLLLKI